MTLSFEKLGTIVDGNTGEILEPGRLRGQIAARRVDFEGLGCGPGDCVALVQENGAGFFVNLFALWELGACVLPLSPSLTEHERELVLSHSGARFEFRACAIREMEAGEAPPPGTALLLYTSGTESTPKGVMLTFDAIRAKLGVLLAACPAADLARTLCLLPLSFGHGLLGVALPTITTGNTLVLLPAYGASALQLGNLIDEHRITFLSSVPSLWAGVLPFAEPPRARTLRRVYCASSPLSVEEYQAIKVWLGPGVVLKNVYGLTEAASWVAGLPDGVEYAREGEVGAGWGAEFRVDPANGEILLRAPYLMSGYHRDPVNPYFSEGILRTGDQGEIGPGGLRLLGRLKDQISRGGHKISPAEVEHRLRLSGVVREVAVFGVPDPQLGEEVHAAVVLKPGAFAEPEGLQQFCREVLSEHKIPVRFHFLAELPRNERGKVAKAKLKEMLRG